MTSGLQVPKGMLLMAASASPEPFMPSPRAKPPATIQMTAQSISFKSLAVMTPVTAKIPIGIMATVLESIPVYSFGITQSRMVTMNVRQTTHMRQPRAILPSMFSSMVFCVKGKNFRMMRHEMSSRMMVSGNMNDIHCPKPSPMFSPASSLRYFSAMAFGGVPIGVPIPPMLAATGMHIVSAIRPLPLAGSAAKTGVRKVSIMAAVAVFDTNMENRPVMSRKPSNTFSLFFPNGRMRFLASSTSSPDFVAAMARMNPPRNSMITGSAKAAMISLDFSSWPKVSFSSPLKIASELLEMVRHIVVMMVSDVAHEGMHSVSHERVANTKMAMIRCWTTVSPSIPNVLVGRFHTRAVMRKIASNSSIFFFEYLLSSALEVVSAAIVN